MSAPLSANLNEDPCPITEQLFGQIRRASPPDAIEIAKTLPEQQRARLAMYFYKRRHLHALGLMIASSCDRNVLVTVGGRVGERVFEQSRDPQKTLSEELIPRSSRQKPVSLAGPILA